MGKEEGAAAEEEEEGAAEAEVEGALGRPLTTRNRRRS